MTKYARILVVDDDSAIVRALQRALESQGYGVRSLGLGLPVLATVSFFRPDVVLLDLVLPDADGIDICRELRKQSDVPIIVLSVLGDDTRKVQALDAGADDYLTKPFSLHELNARIRVALRHGAGRPAGTTIEIGSIRLDLAAHTVTVAGEGLHLTPKEFQLCRILMENRGRLLTQDQILTAVWGPDYAGETHILRTFVHQLRGKLESASPGAERLIVNEPRVGYRMTDGGV